MSHACTSNWVKKHSVIRILISQKSWRWCQIRSFLGCRRFARAWLALICVLQTKKFFVRKFFRWAIASRNSHRSNLVIWWPVPFSLLRRIHRRTSRHTGRLIFHVFLLRDASHIRARKQDVLLCEDFLVAPFVAAPLIFFPPLEEASSLQMDLFWIALKILRWVGSA